VRLAIEVPGGNRDRWAFDLSETVATNEVTHTPEMPTKLSLPLVPDIDADIPDYPNCGEVWHQPCRPADLSSVDDSDEGDTDGDDSSDGTDNADGADGDSDRGGDDNTTDGDSDSNDESADDSGPGYTVGGALAGLGGAGYLLKRRLNRDGPPDEPE
jgi:PGF-CTERM protein